MMGSGWKCRIKSEIVPTDRKAVTRQDTHIVLVDPDGDEHEIPQELIMGVSWEHNAGSFPVANIKILADIETEHEVMQDIWTKLQPIATEVADHQDEVAAPE